MRRLVAIAVSVAWWVPLAVIAACWIAPALPGLARALRQDFGPRPVGAPWD